MLLNIFSVDLESGSYQIDHAIAISIAPAATTVGSIWQTWKGYGITLVFLRIQYCILLQYAHKQLLWAQIYMIPLHVHGLEDYNQWIALALNTGLFHFLWFAGPII